MEEKDLIIAPDLPEGSHIANAPNGNKYVACPITFYLPESCYRYLVKFSLFHVGPMESPEGIVRSLVIAWCNRNKKIIEPK